MTLSTSRTPPPRVPTGHAFAPGVAAIELPEIADGRPMDVAEAFRDLGGLVLLETGRPDRRARWSFLSADPIAVLREPSDGPDPFAAARQLLGRLDASRLPSPADETVMPPFSGGLMGYVGYDVGRRLERLPELAVADQDMPLLQLALHDWVIAWDHRAGRAWLLGRTLDGDTGRLEQRLEAARERAIAIQPAWPAEQLPRLSFRSGMDRASYAARVEAVRSAIAAGEIYQANLARRLEAPFDGDPWGVYRRVRTGDPAALAAYVSVGAPADDAPDRAIVSASPEPFLTVDPSGRVTTDPIKGTRRRGRDRAEDRALARELLSSGKDRAENVMIVDVLRNDLGRVCEPGSVRVTRLCRLERTATVQHLVSTVTGRLAPDRDVFDLLAASLPGGSITGAPKIRAMEILESLEPVRRGPYTGAAGWIGADGAMGTSILIRTFVADGHRLTLHVGGGITWRSDPAAEWDETLAKAAGPLTAIGAKEAE
jgi:para-aminobenzoate synthetase component 1